jgi:hypothetical protein
MVEREFEGIAHVIADRGNRTAERADEADFYGFLLGRRRGRCKKRSRSRGQKSFAHTRSSQGPSALFVLIF